jgi:hypothetical protein
MGCIREDYPSDAAQRRTDFIAEANRSVSI